MIERLRKRRDFLATAKGKKAARRAFVLEVRQREDADPPRFGFTVSKRTAKSAVERNRIRRRLKEAVRLASRDRAFAGHDYVVVGRRSALNEPFGNLRADIASALHQVTGRGGEESSAEARNRVR
jgi:ribonuclease P protein component